MKGTVFCEFLNMVEENFGYELADTIISESNLPNDGAYTTVGTYDFSELLSLLMQLNKHTGIPIPKLLYDFGKYLFKYFLKKYPEMFQYANNGFSFLQLIHDKIHVEVLKLYPDAELPSIKTSVNENELTMRYISKRKLGELAKGLINGCMEYFNEKYKLEEYLVNQDGSEVVFIINKL